MSETVIDSKPLVFSRLFQQGQFTVPWHQRRYDWKKDDVSDLLRDIDEAISENRRCYFLGAIMLVDKGNNYWEINDGQQRMVTFSLICTLFCQRFHEENKTHLEALALRILFDLNEFSTEYLSSADNLTPRLTPPRDDRSRYNLMIRGRSIGANGNLTVAWHEIDNFVAGMEIEKVEIFFRFLIEKVEIACLYIPDDIDPNSVYETINCRGKQLEDLDLVRNYLYSYFNSNEEKNRRDTIHSNLENARNQLRDDTKAADYTRCYFQCRYGHLPKTRFYRKVRQHIGSNASNIPPPGIPATYVYDLVCEFAEKDRVELFRVISNPKTATEFLTQFLKDSNSTRSKRNLSVFLWELQTYKVAQPILFALLVPYIKETNSAHKKKLAKFIHGRIKDVNSFIMRTAFVSRKFEPSHFESEFSDLARQITSAITIYDINIMDHLKEYDTTYNVIDDTKFVDEIVDMDIRDTRKAKRFLIGLNSYQQTDGDIINVIDDTKFVDEIVDMDIRDTRKAKRFLIGLNSYQQTDGDIINVNKSTVEHILPKAKEHWPGWHNFQQKNPADWVYRIGNLTLLGENDNKPGKAFNKDFITKKDIFINSVFTLTKNISKYSDWSPDTINERQEELALLAAKVWAFNV